MVNVKLLRQQVTDYQRQREVNRRRYEGQYATYSADTEAFNALVQKGYDTSAQIARNNDESDLDNVGFDYYDRDTRANVSAGGTRNPAGARTFGLDAPANPDTPHNTGLWETGEYLPFYRWQVDPARFADGNARLAAAGVNTWGGDNPVWDAYDKVWRNAPSGGVAPVERSTKAPNLTLKEVGILEGKVNPMSYADMSKEDVGANSAFADPEDPYNLKDAGVLTRAIAGKI